MASCVRNIFTKNYQNLIIGFQITVENVRDASLGHSVQLMTFYQSICLAFMLLFSHNRLICIYILFLKGRR